MLSKVKVLFRDGHSEDLILSENDLVNYMKENRHIVSVSYSEVDNFGAFNKKLNKIDIVDNGDGIHIKLKKPQQ